MADYAAVYGHLPAPSMPWPLFQALVDRMPRFQARERLGLMDSVAWAIGRTLAGSQDATRERMKIFRLAYPNMKTAPEFAIIQSGKNGDDPA